MIFHGTLYGNKLYDGVEYQGYSTNQRIETQLWKIRPDLILKLSQNCLMWPYKGTVKYGHKRQMVAYSVFNWCTVKRNKNKGHISYCLIEVVIDAGVTAYSLIPLAYELFPLWAQNGAWSIKSNGKDDGLQYNFLKVCRYWNLIATSENKFEQIMAKICFL